MKSKAITIFLARGRNIRVRVVLFILVVLGLVYVFGPTPCSCHDFSSSSYRQHQILLPKSVTSKLVKLPEKCDKLC